MKVIEPNSLLAEAAAVLRPVSEHVVLIGAAAIQIALADSDATVTPTRDLDLGVGRDRGVQVIAHLEDQGMKPSDVPHEQGFTWVKGDLKVQLLREFEPFPPAEVGRLPQNDVLSIIGPSNLWEVSFATAPDVEVFRSATPGALVVLKERAFGRTRAETDTVVKRDFSDVALLIEATPSQILVEAKQAPSTLKPAIVRACTRLLENRDERRLAVEELVAIGHEPSEAAADRNILRNTRLLLDELDVG